MNKERPHHEMDFELNLAPIIDCFVVLITYMLMSACFISLNALDVGAAASGSGGAATGAPPLAMAMKLMPDKSIEIKLTGGKDNLNSVTLLPAVSKGQWDIKSMSKKIQNVVDKTGSLKEITLSADPKVDYNDLIKVLEPLKAVISKVFLAP